MRVFKEPAASRNQLILMPQSLDEMVGPDEPVRLLSDVMDRLDYGALERSYPGGGCPAYSPKMLAKILVLGYSQGIRSSRKIAQATRVDLRYIWLCEGLKPDFRTLARFRRQKWEYLEDLFRQSVKLCQEMGLVLLEYVAIDGTKIESSSGRDALWTAERIAKQREVVHRILEEAEAADACEDEEFGDNDATILPNKLAEAKERLRLIDEAAKRLEASESNAVSLSDPDARQMRTRNGIRMSYNLQAAVDEHSQIVVGMKVVQYANDRSQLGGMLTEIYENTGCRADMVVADNGYYSPANLKALNKNCQTGVIATAKRSPQTTSRGYGLKQFVYEEDTDAYICPQGKVLIPGYTYSKGKTLYRRYRCNECRGCVSMVACGASSGGKRLDVNEAEGLRQQMESLLATQWGKVQMALRKQVVEPVFGQSKENRGFRRFILRGLVGAWAESSLEFLAHNLTKAVTVAPSPA